MLPHTRSFSSFVPANASAIPPTRPTTNKDWVLRWKPDWWGLGGGLPETSAQGYRFHSYLSLQTGLAKAVSSASPDQQTSLSGWHNPTTGQGYGQRAALNGTLACGEAAASLAHEAEA